MSEVAIKENAERRGIRTLYHFTKARNLASIVEHGLLSVRALEQKGIDADRNDQLRLDERTNGISLSIMHPNHRMLWRYRSEDRNVDWAILAISKRVLWEKDCAFCRHNAASNVIRNEDTNALKTVAAFDSMFHEHVGFSRTNECTLKECDPTDVQAEVLCFDNIETKYLQGIAYINDRVLQFGSKLGWPDHVVHKRVDILFSARHRVRGK